MTFKQHFSSIIGGTLILTSMLASADADKRIADFVKLNSWYCEQPVANADALLKKLQADDRLQADKAHASVYQWSDDTSLSLMAHQQGCTTVASLSATDKLSLKETIKALNAKGYKKLSQNVGYSKTSETKALISETVFEKAGSRAVLVYPMDKQGKQQLSLTTANYTVQPTANSNSQASNKVDMHRQMAGTKGKNGWYEARSTHGQFSVLMPLKFNDFTIKGDKEQVRSVEMIGTKSDEGIKFLASRTFYAKPGLAQQFFEKFTSGQAVPKAPRKQLKFKGYDAVLIEAANKKIGTSQLVMKVDDTLVLLAVEWPQQHAKAAKQLGDVFFKSFKAQ